MSLAWMLGSCRSVNLPIRPVLFFLICRNHKNALDVKVRPFLLGLGRQVRKPRNQQRERERERERSETSIEHQKDTPKQQQQQQQQQSKITYSFKNLWSVSNLNTQRLRPSVAVGGGRKPIILSMSLMSASSSIVTSAISVRVTDSPS